jgi:NADH:ubiquinone reductase (H+-translocating)
MAKERKRSFISSSMKNGKTRIVILGGGFAGVYTALYLEKQLLDDEGVETVLISDENFVLFTPMLPEVPSSSIEAKHIVSPLRAFFRKVKVQNREVHSIDLETRTLVASHCAACEQEELRFDHLVLALGSRTNSRGVPGVAEHALPMKSLNDAIALRNRIIDVFEHADLQQDALVRKRLLTFVVAGAGFAGVETVAELKDFSREARRFYPNIRPEEVRILLVHPGSRILPEISETLAGYALQKLQDKGVEIRLNTRISGATDECVEVGSGQKIPARTLVWTAGVSAHPLVATLPCPKTKQGSISVNAYLEVPGCPGVWALGDCASVPDLRTGRPCPPTAQHAIRQASIAGHNIAATLRGGTKERFSFKPLGVLACLGRRSAVAEIGRFRFSGFFAWWLWRTIYLFKLPGLERKVRVAMDWTLDLFFHRDIVLLKVFMNRAPEPAAQSGPPRAVQAGEHQNSCWRPTPSLSDTTASLQRFSNGGKA